MAAGGGGGQQNQSESSGFLWIIAAVFVAIGAIWIFLKQYIISAYFILKLWEIKLVSYFSHGLDDVQAWILLADPSKLPFQDVVKVGQAVGEYIRIPCVILLLILAAVVFFNSSTRVFKRIYSMKDLVEAEKVNWPQIVPVASLNLIKADIDKGPWAMALTPMQFCKRYKLLEERMGQPEEGKTRKEWSRIEVTLKRGLANKVFALQLGPTWQGTDKLPLHTKALFAIFAARYNSDSKVALDLLRQISASSTTKLDFSGIEELCKKHEGSKGVQKIINRHSYVLTVMASMLEAAREDGVQASADFLWLKPIDRRLWYMLNTVGRQTPFVEVAGPFAHWLAEKEIDRGLLVPMVAEATNALDLTLQEIIYKPDEEEA